MLGGEDTQGGEGLDTGRFHSWAASGGRSRQGQGWRGQELDAAASCTQRVRGTWAGRQGDKCLREDRSDKGKVWMR